MQRLLYVCRYALGAGRMLRSQRAQWASRGSGPAKPRGPSQASALGARGAALRAVPPASGSARGGCAPSFAEFEPRGEQ
eukprot:15298188-Alexandrium_andersonii.AAC.1